LSKRLCILTVIGVALVMFSSSLFSKEIVELDLKNGTFKSAIPFDVPFILKITADPHVKRITVYYHPDTAKEDFASLERMILAQKKIVFAMQWMSMLLSLRINPNSQEISKTNDNKIEDEFKQYSDSIQGKKLFYERYQNELADNMTYYNSDQNEYYPFTNKFDPCINSQGDHFLADIDSLSPNKKYVFYFEIYENLDESQTAKTIAILKRSFSEIQGSNGEDCCNQKKEEVEGKINTSLKQSDITFLGNDCKPEIFKFAEPEDVKYFNNICASKTKEKSALLNVGNLLCKLRDAKPISFPQLLCKYLKNPAELDTKSKDTWNKAIFSRLERLKDLTLSDVAVIWVDGLQLNNNNMTIKDIMEGNAILAGKSICPAEELDLDSVVILKEFLKILTSTTFVFEGKTLFQSNPEIFNLVSDLIEKLDKFTESLKLFDEMVEEFCKSKKFNLTNLSISKIESVFAEIHAKDYFSLDFGVGYSWQINSTFLYTGVNIYLVPVNKNASYPLFKNKGYGIPRRASLLLGVTNTKIGEGNSENLFANNNLLAGIGLRINRSFKINFGELLYRQANKNPLIETKKTKLAFFASGSFDIDFLKILGKLGSLF